MDVDRVVACARHRRRDHAAMHDGAWRRCGINGGARRSMRRSRYVDAGRAFHGSEICGRGNVSSRCPMREVHPQTAFFLSRVYGLRRGRFRAPTICSRRIATSTFRKRLHQSHLFLHGMDSVPNRKTTTSVISSRRPRRTFFASI